MKLKIGAKTFTLKEIEGLTDYGSVDFDSQTILIKANTSKDNRVTALIHECLEILNETYDLNLSHQTIQTLEASLYQIIKDNNL